MSKMIISAFAIFFCLLLSIPFGIAILSGSTSDLNSTIPDSSRPAFDAATGASVTVVELLQFVPYIALLIVLIALLMFIFVGTMKYLR